MSNKLILIRAHFIWGCLLCLGSLALLPPAAQAWELQTAPVMTSWAQLVDTNAPLPEYPRPQMVRSNWMNLNGIWQFQPGSDGDPTPTNQVLSGDILVPFPMESALSGVSEHHPRSWYRRTFTVPPAWAGQKLLLHLDAVDWESEVFINGQSLGIHKGGYDQITHDITSQLTGSGPQELIVRVYDPTDNYGQARGKQTLYPGGIMYTSCSGIWQSVWLEPVPVTSVSDLELVPDVDNARLNVTVNVSGPSSGVTVTVVALDGTNVVGSIAGAPGAELLLSVPSPTLWCPTNPFLYDLEVTLSNGPTRLDSVDSYFGMRKVSIGTVDGFVKMLLNDEFIFQFGPLDQGFWPDGIYTAPTDDALKSDIEQTKLFGYNMIRKHIKVEPARWYYWADKLGVLVWQDMPSLNSYTGNPQPIDVPQFETELVRMIETLWNHPSIISWVIFNESQGQHDTESLVAMVQGMDPTRLVNQASGGSFFDVGEILDYHSYPNPSCPVSASQAVVCGEFGGVGLGITNHTWAPGWGYVAATNGDDLAAQFEDFCLQLSGFVEDHGLSAAVYTEITDVEIELNGFLTYDRKVRKPDPDRIRAAIALASTPITMTPVVPTSESTGQTWKYRFDPPSAGWTGTNYNDSTGNWTEGLGGFGSGEPPQTAPYTRTAWTTSDIWLRRTFNPGTLTPQQITNLHFTVFNDEDVEIYINGVLAASATGYRTSYGLLALTPEGRAAILLNATNTLAVHCHQTGGGQYIDVGMSVVEIAVSIPPRPAPSIPTGLKATSGGLGVSLGWDASPEATDYTIKRSTVAGGPYTDLVLVSPINAVSDSSVSNGVTYYYVVSAANASGQSADSAEVSISVVIPVPPPPAVVTWFRADTLSGVTEGEAVSNWPDASGSGYDATQATSNLRPTYLGSAINGLPAVHFDAANDSYLAFTRPVKDDFTIFCVYRSSQGVGTGINFWEGAGLVSGEMPNPVSDFGLSLNADGRLLAGTGNPDVTIASSDPGFNDGQPHLVVFKRTRSTGALELYVDGLPQGTATGGQQSLTAPAQLTLGTHSALVNYLTGDIAEVKIYNAALSESDRVAEETALSCKYGLGMGAPPVTPSGLTVSAGNRQAFVSWMPVVGAPGYKLEWSLNSGGPFTQLSGNLTSTNFVDDNAVAGQMNHYRVAAFSACGTSAFSSAVGVLVPLPTLEASAGDGTLTLSWPDWASDWMVWSTTNFIPPVVWSPVTNSVVSTNGSFQMTVDMALVAEFYQLASP